MSELENLKDQLDYVADKLNEQHLLDEETIQYLTLLKGIIEKKYESESLESR